MIKAIFISDNKGIPYYSKYYESFTSLDSPIMSGLLSSITLIGQNLFHLDIATIKFGDHEPFSSLVIITKNIFHETKKIHFCFFITGKYDKSLLNSIATKIFIEIKNEFYNNTPELSHIRLKLNKIIESQSLITQVESTA